MTQELNFHWGATSWKRKGKEERWWKYCVFCKGAEQNRARKL